MFYKMITEKRDQWLSSAECTVTDLLRYIETTAQMRDAQIDAIKTYLFLKIAGQNRPLWELFSSGAFTSIKTDKLKITAKVKAIFDSDSARLALYQYAKLKDTSGDQVSSKLEELLENDEAAVDCTQAFKDIFGVSYADYLFSLPMGAGKTYLMAAFIYLDLYFAQAEPGNKAFSHNFIIFAPSGLKSSVVPSLRTIRNFDPAWIIPEPAASGLKRMLKFEVLDQQKSAKKSNKAKNPNVQKIANHQPLDELMGLVAVTNAEKVIMDRLEKEDMQLSIFDRAEQDKIRQSMELRDYIGRIPQLSVFVDEVHHVSDENIKLRKVITRWMKSGTVAGTIGFSGTPYLDSAEPISIENLTLKNKELPNVVNYYPLLRGINNFLKNPTVHISDNTDSSAVVEHGIREFFDEYKDTVYPGGLTAKLAIYCGQIAPLEEVFAPIAERVCSECGFNPNDVILKYYGKDSSGKYSCPAENATMFAALDTPLSKIKIVLLAQIGKEGWDCHSLTGIILSQKGDCPTNMVLQTSCRCLRQVQKGTFETAGVWLNKFNADKLNAQLQQQQHISIKEFSSVAPPQFTDIYRYDRRKHLKLPPVDFYQLGVRYDTLVIAERRDAVAEILAAPDQAKLTTMTVVQDFAGNVIERDIDKAQAGDPVTYPQWLYEIAKESFGEVTIPMLEVYTEALTSVFAAVTMEADGVTCYRTDYNQTGLRSYIRLAFAPKTSFTTNEELIPESASLLRVEKLTSPVKTANVEDYYPAQADTDKILSADKGKALLNAKMQETIDTLIATGNEEIAETLRKKHEPLPERDRTYHYLPYHMDSGFELEFFKEIVTIPAFREKGLEIYYNGDRGLTDFKIRCYKGGKGHWRYIGQYTPDFLLVNRKEGKIHQAIIIETKGKGYAKDDDYLDKRTFMETEFKRLNNEQFGYERFDYLYLEDSESTKDRIAKTIAEIKGFFREE